MRSYARYWKETFRLPAMDHDEVFAQLEATVIGAEHIERAVAEGRGIMLPVTHSGNWDIAGLWVTRRWGTMSTVVERLKPESLYEKFVAYRESLGHGDPAADRRRLAVPGAQGTPAGGRHRCPGRRP